MRTTYQNRHSDLGCILVILSFWTMVANQRVSAQTLVSSPMSSTPAAGEYYHPRSITLSPGFNFIATPGSSLRLYISSTNVCEPLATQASSEQNYILTSLPRIPMTVDPGAGNTNCEVMQTIQYFDGLGRPLQTVQVRGNPTGTSDVIQPVSYDQFGREATKYLPYTTANGAYGSYRTNALSGGQQNFYNQSGQGYKNMQHPFSVTVFEASPLNRQLEQGGPGQEWQPYSSSVAGSGHTVKTAYSTNIAGEVRLWQVNTDGSQGANRSTDRTYNAGELYKTTLTDENGHYTIEFKDKQGQVVCKKMQASTSSELITSYVYDDLGNLRYVIPPVGSVPQYFTENDDQAKAYYYCYHYDQRNRLIEKRLPGKGWENTVYNKLDQVVYTQDAVQQGRHERSFIKYDGQGRVIMTGVESGHYGSRADQQGAVDGQAGPLWESRDASGYYGYTLLSLPTNMANIKPLTINYYDRYDFLPGAPFGDAGAGQSKATGGLMTGSLTNILGTSDYLWSANYYDDDGRVVQIRSENHLGGMDVTDNTYSFTGELLASNRSHTVRGSTTTIATTYSYDHMGRKLETKQSINGAAPTTLSSLAYNEVGQLQSKKLGGDVQTVQYTYNERGWMSGLSSSKFSMQLGYNSGSAPQWNGNISTQTYDNNGTSNSFNYSYDELNRLLSGTASGMGETLSYDGLGNIQTLQRDGTSRNYTYYNNGQSNQLRFVSGLTLTDYVYDANGNATTDGRLNKTITYNLLNLPESYSGGPSYTYLANGQKLKKVSGGVTTDYVGAIQYTNGSIELIQHEDGTALRSGTTYSYRYDLKDHLGNVRTTMYRNPVNGQAEVLQQDDYYPFGLRKTGAVSSNNKYLYNGKELQEELNQYDYGARFYDPVIARWTTIDPLAEKFESSSPYTYTYDDPIKHNDPDGMSGEVTIDKNTQTVTVSQRLVFYGGSATTENSARIANGIAAQWNAAGGTTVIDGVKYNVKFKVQYQTVSEDVAKGAAVDDNTLNNFIRVEDVDRSSFMEIGGNSGFFNINDFSDSKSTTGAHEDGHSFGLLHPSKPDGSVDVRGQGQPGIMTPRNSVVDAAFQKDPKAKPGSHPNGTIDPNKRKVTQKNINDIHLEKLKYDKDGKANLGTANHKTYDANGN